MKRKFVPLLSLFIVFSAIPSFPVLANAGKDDIVILYTNDIHTHIDNINTDSETGEETKGLSYDNVAALKKDIMENETSHVLLVDAGDHTQGTIYGSVDKGQSMIELMNLSGYDLATPGNHEFDYQMDGLFNTVDAAEFPYVSCNFMDLSMDEPVFEDYHIFDFDETKIAFVGITTPETYTSTSSKYFEDASGTQIYGFLNSADGELLYETVQKSIDAARAEGADYVIALAHLGVDLSSSPYTSEEVIQNTAGLDAMIDGHSHTTMEYKTIEDKNGDEVCLTQTGCYFANVGKMTIDSDGNISTELISEYAPSDTEVNAARESLIEEVNDRFSQVIADSEIDLKTTDEDGNRIVRIMECSMGDFIADSYYYYINEIENLNCDLAIANAGGIRADIASGELMIKDLQNVSPFGNVICLMKVTGQQIKDALEWGARATSGESDSQEIGCFFQVAGITYEVDTSVTSTVQSDETELWNGPPTGEYRVRNLQVYNKETGSYEPIVPGKEYAIVSINYTLRNNGGGCTMFEGSELIKDYISEDYLLTVEYAESFADSDGDGLANISSETSPLSKYDGYLLDYDSPYGSGRITIMDYSRETETETDLN